MDLKKVKKLLESFQVKTSRNLAEGYGELLSCELPAPDGSRVGLLEVRGNPTSDDLPWNWQQEIKESWYILKEEMGYSTEEIGLALDLFHSEFDLEVL